jgi:hypothetical protein
VSSSFFGLEELRVERSVELLHHGSSSSQQLLFLKSHSHEKHLRRLIRNPSFRAPRAARSRPPPSIASQLPPVPEKSASLRRFAPRCKWPAFRWQQLSNGSGMRNSKRQTSKMGGLKKDPLHLFSLWIESSSSAC